jgi:hypothetical protein
MLPVDRKRKEFEEMVKKQEQSLTPKQKKWIAKQRYPTEKPQ